MIKTVLIVNEYERELSDNRGAPVPEPERFIMSASKPWF